ncbi:hypothetical protein FUA23_00455 [Neolewinella aurantiaca]|uniref:Uncharacterized protein n=1 Tax=Neolewinella aurantiaca TaxID=2602767 RepID=A0A5C7FK41_9BACT|nr:hypothetical protein [Neolewinella aurantiaca]TXF91689.1 hypothetical protein FUA23_00455 [Neolewinella aurantiaca]
MKISALLYFGAFAAMFAVDYLFGFRPEASFYEAGAEHPQVVEFIDGLDKPVDATAEKTVERRFSEGFISRVDVNAGFRIIHDTGLGKEVIARGPATALDLISLSQQEGHFEPAFKQPVRLQELVEIRVNLNRHGSGRMRINCILEDRRTALLPVFATEGPLKFHFLELVNLSPGRIEVDARDLLLRNRKYANKVTGSVERLEVLYDSPSVPDMEFSQLNAKEKIRSNYGASGAVPSEDEFDKNEANRIIDSLQNVIQTMQHDTVSQ